MSKVKKIVGRKSAKKSNRDIVNFCNNNDLLIIPTKFWYPVEGGKKKKTPCYINKISKNNKNIYSPNLGTPFYKWNKQMVKAHSRWLDAHGKLNECDGVIVLLYNTKFIMIDTDDEDAEKHIDKIDCFHRAPTTHSLTKKFGRHRYIRMVEGGNYKMETKIYGDTKQVDIITEYSFESMYGKVDNLSHICEVELNTFQELIGVQLNIKDLDREEAIQRKHNEKIDKHFKIKDKIRNQFLNENEVIPEEILLDLLQSLNPEKFTDYKNWFRLLCGIHNQALNQSQDVKYKSLFCEFMNKNSKAVPAWFQENLSVWSSIQDRSNANPNHIVKSGTLYRYLQEQNLSKFIELKHKRRQQIDPPSFNRMASYGQQKEQFERDCFVIKSEKATFCEMDWVEGEMKERSIDNFKQNFCNLYTTITAQDSKGKTSTKRVPFVDRWVGDEDRKEYDRLNFIPPPLKCNPYTYNLYDGMYIDDLEDEEFEEMSESERFEKLDRLLRHIYYLSGCDEKSYDFLLKIFAYKIKYPANLHKISVVMRSVQGCGKNAFLDWIGNKILGNKYYACSANADDFLGKFNSMVKGKLLCVFNEMDGAVGFAHSARLKEFATEEQIFHEKKGIDRKKIKNCMLTCYASNNKTPVKVEIGDRRFFVVECSDKVLYIPNYFEELFDDLDDPCVAKCFVWYCNNIVEVEEDYNFKKNRPITKVYKELQNKNKSCIVKFCEWVISPKTNTDSVINLDTRYTSNQLWDLFNDFMEYTKMRNRIDKSGFDSCVSEYVYTCPDDKLEIKEYKKIIRKTKNSVYVYRFNGVRVKALIDKYDNDIDVNFDSDVEDDELDFV